MSTESIAIEICRPIKFWLKTDPFLPIISWTMEGYHLFKITTKTTMAHSSKAKTGMDTIWKYPSKLTTGKMSKAQDPPSKLTFSIIKLRTSLKNVQTIITKRQSTWHKLRASSFTTARHARPNWQRTISRWSNYRFQDSTTSSINHKSQISHTKGDKFLRFLSTKGTQFMSQ